MIGVSCGGHSAIDCPSCGPTRSFCNGDCIWRNDYCISRGNIKTFKLLISPSRLISTKNNTFIALCIIRIKCFLGRNKREAETDFINFSNPLSDFTGSILGKISFHCKVSWYIAFFTEIFGVSSTRRVEKHHAFTLHEINRLKKQNEKIMAELEGVANDAAEVCK